MLPVLLEVSSLVSDLFFELLLFVVGSVTLHTRHFALHLLDLEVLLVEELLLSLFLNTKLVDVSLQVS